MTWRVFCTFRCSGFHCWPKAPKEYAYLRSLHRHEFHVRVDVEITDSRQVEFIELKERAQLLFAKMKGKGASFGSKSCEQLAWDLLSKLEEKYDYQVTAVEVSEDGENGAKVYR